MTFGLTTMFLAALVVVGIPTAAASVECGDTVTSNLKLNHDLECGGDGIKVGADEITIKLNGHSIMGSMVMGSVGIRVDGFEDVVIRGPGVVKHFHRGILVTDSADVTIRKVTVLENHAAPGGVSAGIAVVQSTDVEVRGNIALGNGNAGIYLEGSDHVLVKDNRAGRSHHDGIQLFESDFNVIKENLAFENQAGNGCGINLIASHNNRIQENDVRDNVLAGIQIAGGSTGNKIRENELEGNSLEGAVAVPGGIRVVGSTGNTFVENEVEEGINGIFFGITTGNTYRENEIEENECGIKGTSSAKEGNVWIENEFEDNEMDECPFP